MLHQFILYTIISVGFLLLAFIAMANPMRVNITANRWLAVFLFSVACLFTNNLLYTTGQHMQYWQLVVFGELSRFLIAPALYLSILHYTSPNKSISKVEGLHFIPFLVFGIYMAPAIWLKHPAFSLQGVSPVLYKWVNIITVLTMRIQVLVYWCLAYHHLNRHQKNVQLIESDTTPVGLNWLKGLLWGLAGMLLLGYGSIFIHMHWLVNYTPYGYLLGMLVIIYYLLAQKEVYSFEPTVLAEVNITIQQERSKKAKQRFTSEEARQLATKLEVLMQTEKVYLDNELNLPQLAQQMALTTHDLSYLLNECIGVNFFQFINGYRVQEAKHLMLSGQHKHLNILGIAYNAGFNSKTTFNTVFKKETGLSPTQFLKQVNGTVANHMLPNSG